MTVAAMDWVSFMLGFLTSNLLFIALSKLRALLEWTADYRKGKY